MNREKKIVAVLVMTAGFLVLYHFFRIEALLYLTLAVSILSLMSSFLLEWITKAWFGLAKVLGYINARILLSLVFFIVLMPFAFLSRIFSGNSLQLKKKEDDSDSYFDTMEETYTAKDFENIWQESVVVFFEPQKTQKGTKVFCVFCGSIRNFIKEYSHASSSASSPFYFPTQKMTLLIYGEYFLVE